MSALQDQAPRLLQVFILPTIRINSGQYRGKLAYREVLTALCAGFSEDNQPEVCLRVADDSCRPGGMGDSVCKARWGPITLQLWCSYRRAHPSALFKGT